MPIINDIVTLGRGRVQDTRVWNGSNWVQQDKIIDGSLIASDSIVGGVIAGNTINATNIQANSIGANNILANSLHANNFRTNQAIIKASIQIGNGNITFSNLSPNLIGDFGITQTVPLHELFVETETHVAHSTTYSLSPSKTDIVFRRNADITQETITVSLSLMVYTTYFIFVGFVTRTINVSVNVSCRLRIGPTYAQSNIIPGSTLTYSASKTTGRITGFQQIELDFEQTLSKRITLSLALSPLNVQQRIYVESYYDSVDAVSEGNNRSGFLVHVSIAEESNAIVTVQEKRPFRL